MIIGRRQLSLSVLPGIIIPILVASASARSFDKNRELSRLVSRDPREQQEAMRNLETNGDDAVPDILDIVEKNKDQETKVRAASTARRILKRTKKPSEQVFASLERMSDDPDYTVADSAVSISMDLRTERARKLIRNAARNHPNETVRGKAITALRKASGANTSELESFRKALADPSDMVKMRAAAALGQLGRSDGLNAVIAVLDRTPDAAQAGLIVEASHAAAMIGDPGAVPSLEKASMQKKYGPARVHAVVAIREIELRTLKGDQRLDFLKNALGETKTAGWAAAKLKEMGTRRAISVLRQTAGDLKHPAREEAARVLSQPNIDD